MNDSTKRIIITSSILVSLLVLTIGVMLFDLDLKIIKFTSIKSLVGKHREITEVEEKLSNQEAEYKNEINSGKLQQKEFHDENAKYNAISDDTINIIKEATTKENYNIEYMWIRLGNYAKSNNLKIVLAEPGNTIKEVTDEKNKTNSKTGTSETSQTTNDTQASSSSSNASTDQSAVENSSSNLQKDSNNNLAANNNETLFKIQVAGSYLDVSDFIFEVENDKELRFKLDNISMDYVSGTTIKASFNVKNLIINK